MKNRASSPKVGCAGIIVADTFCGPMKQLPPAGQLAVLESIPTKAGGCAANVAIDLAKQGIEVEISGCVGNDAYASFLEAELSRQGVKRDRIVRNAAYPTSRTVILLIEGQDRRYLHNFGANEAYTVSMIDRTWIASLDVFYLGGLFAMPKINTSELTELFRFCREQGVITVLDVVLPETFSHQGEFAKLLPLTDYFLPNEDEAHAITGHRVPLDQLHALQDLGARTTVLTRGESGSMAIQGKEFWKAGAFPMEALDPSGSGDAFAGGVIAGLVRKLPMPEILRIASALGASATRRLGTTDGVFTSSELDEFLSTHDLEVISGRSNS